MKLTLMLETEEIDDLKMFACARDAFAALNSIENQLRNFMKYSEAQFDSDTHAMLDDVRSHIREVMSAAGYD